jgi:RHS repeat-associated protein
VTYPNGLQSSFTYDDLNRITAMNAAKASYSYTLGPTGNRTGAVESSGRTLNWSYDGIYRLTNETISLDPHSNNGAVSYGLDPVGNRQQQTSSIPGIGTGSFTFDPDDRLNTETYDADGNTLTTGGKTFAYDFENRLKSMNAGTVTIQYDADGNRASKTVNGVTTRFLVDDLNPTGWEQVVEEVVGGATQRTYTYGLQLISQNQVINNAWTPSFYGYDGGGSVRTLTDSTGAITDTYDYDAWGNTVNVTGTTANVYLYRGEQYDPDMQLYYLRARYFNPATGRFLTRDTGDGDISLPSTLHSYLYAAGDPVNRLDRSGNDEMVENALLVAAVTLATETTLLELQAATSKSIKCVWCEAFSQLAAGFQVDLLPAGVIPVAETAGRTLCTVTILTTMPWYFAHHGKGKGSWTRTGDKHAAGTRHGGPWQNRPNRPDNAPPGYKGPWPPPSGYWPPPKGWNSGNGPWWPKGPVAQ